MNVALIGIGTVSKMHLDTIKKLNENIVALCDIVPSKAQKAKEEYKLKCNIYKDFNEMFDNEKIDVVHIMTPHYLHAEMICEALKRNINCLCEKPLAISASQLNQIEKACLKSKAKLGVCFQRRFWGGAKLIQKIFKDNPILSANGNLSWCRDSSYYEQDAWRGKKTTEGGGVLINQAIHIIDLVIYLMGYPNSVIGYTSNDTLKDVIDVEESAFVIFKYKDGRRFLLEASNANNKSHELSISFSNNKHNATLIGETLYIDQKLKLVNESIFKEGKKEWGNGHFALIKNFYECVVKKKDFLINFKEARKTIDLILAIYKSNGKEVKV